MTLKEIITTSLDQSLKETNIISLDNNLTDSYYWDSSLVTSDLKSEQDSLVLTIKIEHPDIKSSDLSFWGIKVNRELEPKTVVDEMDLVSKWAD